MSLNRSIQTFAAVVILFCATAVQAADQYKIDPVHSFSIFRIHHMNTGYVYGRVNGPSGEIDVDDSDASKDSFNVTLDVENIDTNNAKRDEHLKSPDFFSAKEFPQMTFKSTAVKPNGDDKLDVTGDLTIHGQTKSVTVTITKTGSSDTPQMGKRVGFESTFTIKRSDFGMSKMLEMVSDEVQITVAFEAGKQG